MKRERERERGKECKGEGKIETYNCVAVAKANAGKVFHFLYPVGGSHLR